MQTEELKYQASLAFANEMDLLDPLKSYKEKFYIPDPGKIGSCIYFTGNSLGLQPKTVRAFIEQELLDWEKLGVEGHFHAKNYWLDYHELLTPQLAKLTGAKETEVIAMNSLTVNLHLMLVSFYQPTGKRTKIVIEKGAFPSDQYAVTSHVIYHGYDPADCVIELTPKTGENNIREEDIEELLQKEGDSIAFILLGGVNYYSGQAFDMKRITEAGHKAGSIVGFDLAHAIGNLELSLHDWDVDFAVWCSYKYLNSGPGGVGGCFVHERYAKRFDLSRFSGWWGHEKPTRFQMGPVFKASEGAVGWQLSNAPVLAMAALRASLEIFEQVGIRAVREKSKKLTGFLLFLLNEIKSDRISVITPKEEHRRGCQLSIRVKNADKSLFEQITAKGVIADWREPDVIRIAPVPLYNTFNDVYRFVEILKQSLQMAKQRVIIVGAGLSGSLLAIYLAKKGMSVDIYEARSDMRHSKVVAGRSINLALSDRGIMALREVGMDAYMLKEAIPMKGRLIHTLKGETNFQPYSGRQGEYINSVSRGGLNIALMNEAEKYEGVKFYFDYKCVGFDCKTGDAFFEHGKTSERKTVKGDTVIGTDGAGSAIRNAMLHGGVQGFNFSQRFLEHGYKELSILPGDNGGFRMEKNALHIWPRGSYMMIALPNFDGSFTCTLFLAYESPPSAQGGAKSFAAIDDKNKLIEFFKANFPDAIPLMPTLEDDFFTNPTGNLGTIKCFPWNVAGKSLLIGDSAHAVVPFYGQGMNCAFEDCRSLSRLIDEHGSDWERIYTAYGALRKENTDAIADMAEENFYEMRDYVADPVFQRKRELETKLEQSFPDYFSKYSMVTFREDLPYVSAMKKGRAQDKMLMEICSSVDDVKKLNLNEVFDKIKNIDVRM